jgi:hypothetical protein
MTIRVFSDEDLERLRSFPEINREELIRFFGSRHHFGNLYGS